MLVHGYPGFSEIEVKDLWVTQLLGLNHPERPYSPEEVVQKEALPYLLKELMVF